MIDVESQLAPRIVDSTSASDGERAVHHFAHSAGAPTLLGVDVHDSNAGVQQWRNQVQTHVISENADARIVATGRLQGGLERRVLAPVVVPQGADGQTVQTNRIAFHQQKQLPDNNAHLLRSCGLDDVAAVPHLSNGTVGQITRYAKHGAIVRNLCASARVSAL